MAVALMNGFSAIELIGFGGFIQHTWVGSKTQGAADVLNAVLLWHQVDHRVGSRRVKLNTVGILKADYVPGKFYNGKLHAKTQTQERNTMFAGIADRSDFAVDSSVAETARNQDSGHIRKSRPAFSGVTVSESIH